jgi:hypothetical protein
VSDELERTVKAEIVSHFKVQFQHLFGGKEENYRKSIRTAGLQSKIQTWDLSNTRHKV